MRPSFSSDRHDLARARTRQRPRVPLITSGDTLQLCSFVAFQIFLPILVAHDLRLSITCHLHQPYECTLRSAYPIPIPRQRFVFLRTWIAPPWKSASKDPLRCHLHPRHQSKSWRLTKQKNNTHSGRAKSGPVEHEKKDTGRSS